jgi:hypothetical protein
MSNKHLCTTFAGGVYAHTYIYNYNCNCIVINTFKSYFLGEMFDAHKMTKLYYYISYLISSSLKHTVQHRCCLDEVAPGN